MINVVIISPQENLRASDLLLDEMEKQTITDTTATWMDTFKSYWNTVLSTLGDFINLLKKPTKTDAACQTEDLSYPKLTVSRSWQSCHVKSKYDSDYDSQSSTDVSTNFSTFENNLHDDWEDDNSSSGDDLFQAICDASEAHSDCDCETEVEQLLL